MKEILDEEISVSPGNERSRKACIFFVLNLLCVLLIISITFFIRSSVQQDLLQNGFMMLIIIFFLFSILGFRNAVLSFLKKEEWTYIKIVGFIGNFVFIGIVILLFVANILDVIHYLSG